MSPEQIKTAVDAIRAARIKESELTGFLRRLDEEAGTASDAAQVEFGTGDIDQLQRFLDEANAELAAIIQRASDVLRGDNG